jgi:hypothetical protein
MGEQIFLCKECGHEYRVEHSDGIKSGEKVIFRKGMCRDCERKLHNRLNEDRIKREKDGRR